MGNSNVNNLNPTIKVIKVFEQSSFERFGEIVSEMAKGLLHLFLRPKLTLKCFAVLLDCKAC